MKSLLSLFTIAISSVSLGFAQDINGKVVLANGDVSYSSTLTLHNQSDSVILKYSAVDENGMYVFEDIAPGNYFIKAEELGYAEGYSEAFTHTSADLTLKDIVIDAVTTEYEEVNIVYKKPIVELRPDMTIFNVDSTINSVGLDAFELLRKSPGVVVDKDDNISLNGKSGLIVMIDGRVTPMNGKELSDYLRSIPSNTIDKIELISNPSAKYDASGNAGIINIRLKKNDNVGTHGSVNLGYSVGVYSKYDGGINLNRRSSKTNIYGAYSYRTGNNWSQEHLGRGTPDTIYKSKNESQFNSDGHTYKAGIDYYVNNRSTIGAMVQGVNRNYDYNSTNLQEVFNTTEELMRYYKMNNNQVGSRNNINGNVNYSYRNPDNATSLTWDVDYGIYNFKNVKLYPYDYYDRFGNSTHQISQKYDMPVDIQILTSKVDYERNLGKGKLSTGVKVSNINTENLQETYWDKGTGWEFSPLESNEYDYIENIQAVYAQYQEQINHFNYYVGLRFENTSSKGRSIGLKDVSGTLVPFDSTLTRHHQGLFPNAGITYSKDPMNQWSINYSRRIDRPNNQDLNPFVFRVDDNFDRVGNGYLRPQLSNKFSIGHTYKYMFNTRLEYTRTKDLFGELIDTVGNRLSQSKQNINSLDMISLNVSMPFRWNKFSVFTNLNAAYARYQGEFGTYRKVDLDAFTFNAYGQASYNINAWLTAEISGWYASPSVFQGTFRSIGMGGIDAGLQARVLNNKGVFKLSVGDVFKTMKWGGTSDFFDQKVSAHGYWESQKIALNFNYNFGNNKIKQKNRDTAIDDEKTRIESEGGQGGGGGIK